ncbi:MAG: NAD(P)H-hydrate dehydratase, partial [Candidatus Margulisbacteria bacterium]|nr:NAD(P)H-hydrate dehydratase [Candidatus Margulisiibacteriota bacterium]
TGAAVLASRAALRSGAGLVYLAVPNDLVKYVDCLTAEVITIPFSDIKKIKADVIAIGPGLGTSKNCQKLVASVLRTKVPVVIDADAINIIAKKRKLLAKRKHETIITPHPGEMSRLVGKDVKYVQQNRLVVAKKIANKYNCIVVLKGAGTVVADRYGDVYINNTGNPGMASAGVGDVLTGMIAGLKAQGQACWGAAVAGVYLHGLAGDLAAKDKGEYGMIASDLVEKIPYAIQKSR